MKRVTWSIKKNEKLKTERGVSFEEVLFAVEQGHLIAIEKNPSVNYPHQYLMVVLIKDYPHEVPFIETEEQIELITIFPNRKRKKLKGT